LCSCLHCCLLWHNILGFPEAKLTKNYNWTNTIFIELELPIYKLDLIFGLGTRGLNKKCIEIVVSTLNSLGFFFLMHMWRFFFTWFRRRTVFTLEEGSRFLMGLARSFVHCLKGNQILVGWFYNGCVGEASLEKL
jgi:hypothetical protein